MQHLPVFVYGTLQRGEERAGLWPRPVVRVESAVTHGRLYDLGPYPAMVPGDELIEGELWHVAEDDLAATLATLDAIEHFGQGDEDLYKRCVVECISQAGHVERAHTYIYARQEEVERFPAVEPDASGCCRWHRCAEK